MTVKPGHKTTEFLATALTVIGSVAAAVAGALPAKWAAIASAVSVSAYSIGRSITKAGAGGGS